MKSWMLPVMLILCFVLAACSGSMPSGKTETEQGQPDSEAKGKEGNKTIPQTGYTTEVPKDYQVASKKPGTVTRLDYDSKDYARDEGPVTKTAYVYTPYGYDEKDRDTRYDIIYLMHGWGGHAGEYFGYTATKNMFDHMIENGDIPPAIIVSATFYNENSDGDFSSSEAELHAFHQDFENHLMPTVEKQYHTYAQSVSKADLKASRDHRVFGGFSLGSVTTWLQFCYDYDYIRYYIPMSGSSWYYGTYGDFQINKNVDFIEKLVKEQELDERGYFIYHAVGTEDAVKSQSIMMADEMLEHKSVFMPDHYVFYQKDGGYHDLDAVREYLYNALPVILPGSGQTGDQKNISGEDVNKDAFTKKTPISDVIDDPVFGDYGRLIFPADSGYMSGDKLGNLDLTWYNNIDPDKTVEICNYLREHAAAGKTVFYDIYSDAEKKADPEKEDAGLFFFKGKPGEKFAVCSAGGGFAYVGAMHDSFPHALELSKKGYNAFALIYRPGAQTACEDLARAIAYIFEHADELEVDTDGYSLWGGSAGARMAAWLGSYGTEGFGEKTYPRPGAVIMQYTGLSEYSKSDPPTYACCGTRDGIASWRGMKTRLDAMAAAGIPTEFHSYKGLSHGFGLGTGTVAEGWIEDAVAFWEGQR